MANTTRLKLSTSAQAFHRVGAGTDMAQHDVGTTDTAVAGLGGSTDFQIDSDDNTVYVAWYHEQDNPDWGSDIIICWKKEGGDKWQGPENASRGTLNVRVTDSSFPALILSILASSSTSSPSSKRVVILAYNSAISGINSAISPARLFFLSIFSFLD